MKVIELIDSDGTMFGGHRAPPSRMNGSRQPSPGAGRWMVGITIAVIFTVVVANSWADGNATAHPPTTPHLSSTPSTFGSAAESAAASVLATSVLANTNGQCSDDRIPFHPTYLPMAWRGEGSTWSGRDPLTGRLGVVEVAHGAGLPVRSAPSFDVRVLGRHGAIGRVSDGYEVVFTLGAESDPCEHWALIAPSPLTAATLQRIAEGLTLFSAGTATLECSQAYPTEQAPAGPAERIVSGIALPADRALDVIPSGLPSGVTAVFARFGLLSVASQAFEVRVKPESIGKVGLSWQSGGAPVSGVHVPACAGTGWLTRIGGLWAMEPVCAHLTIRTEQTSLDLRVGIGVACPPPPAIG